MHMLAILVGEILPSRLTALSILEENPSCMICGSLRVLNNDTYLGITQKYNTGVLSIVAAWGTQSKHAPVLSRSGPSPVNLARVPGRRASPILAGKALMPQYSRPFHSQNDMRRAVMLVP
jgi:hypothetical protein